MRRDIVQGAVLREMGRSPQSISSYKEARANLHKVVAAEPNVAEHQHDLARTWNSLGNLHNAQDQPELALLPSRSR